MTSKSIKLHIFLLVISALAPIALFATDADEKFTIAVIPDTRNYLDYTHQTAQGFPLDANNMFIEQMQYIAENLKSEGGDIAFVSALGDIWQHQTRTIDNDHKTRGFKPIANPLVDQYFAPTEKARTVEMPKAHEGFSLIAGKVPFSVVPGNHDHDAMWTDASHPPADDASLNDFSSLGVLHPGGLDNFRSVFGSETEFFQNKEWYVASNDGGADSAQIFFAGGYHFLHIALQFSPADSSLEWAAKVIEKYSGMPTIVSTHDYLNPQGLRKANPIIDARLVDSTHNSAEMVWQKFISRHDQIFLVLCGHQGAQARRMDLNVFGNPVWQLLSSYQGRNQTAKDTGWQPVPGQLPQGIGDGWMRLMTFDMSGNDPVIHVQTYSTHYRVQSSNLQDYAKWYKEHEQPHMTGQQFYAADDFRIRLHEFNARFSLNERSDQ